MAIQLIPSFSELQIVIAEARASGKSVGFVPTMGALHEGHASLMREALIHNDIGIASVFVNPTQFGPNEDFDRYPRTLEADTALLGSLGTHYVYAPAVGDIYPEGRNASEVGLHLRGMDRVLCGASRPGHFNGVMQVVAKLLHQVQPTRAYFGQKDWQQLSILARMVRELFFPVEIVGCPIIREPDGLAMSSRNRYLSAEERQQALFLSAALSAVKKGMAEGAVAADAVAAGLALLPQFPLIKLDYLEIRNESTLESVDVIHAADKPRVFVAAWCGTTRLIDNGGW